jgi:hypothetical protein
MHIHFNDCEIHLEPDHVLDSCLLNKMKCDHRSIIRILVTTVQNFVKNSRNCVCLMTIGGNAFELTKFKEHMLIIDSLLGESIGTYCSTKIHDIHHPILQSRVVTKYSFPKFVVWCTMVFRYIVL